nr:hypothetical protein [Tanacetum cinerariifolium]
MVPTEVPIVPADPLVAPEVAAVFVTLPAEVLDWVDYSSSFGSDPSEDSLPLAPELPLVSPFLCSDDLKADCESEPAEQRLKGMSLLPFMTLWFRGGVTGSHLVHPHHSSSSGSSSHSSLDTSSGSPLDSLSDTSSVHSLGCDASGQTNSGPSTRVASSSLGYPPVMTPRYSEAFRRSRPSQKRCRSLTTSVASSTPMEICTADAEDVADLGISDGVGADTKDGIGIREEFRQMRRDRDDARSILRRLKSFVKRRLGSLLCQNGSDGDNGNGENGDRGNNRNGNPNENGRGTMPVAHVCTIQDFVKCQLLNFEGTKGVFGLTRWFEKMETVFHISNCPEVYQVKYATCTLLNSALTWWNSHRKTIGVDFVFAMTWRVLMKLMTEVYCPRNEIQKMETEL